MELVAPPPGPMWSVGEKLKGGVVMEKLREKTVEEILLLATYKLAKQGGGKKTRVFVPFPFIPPVPPYRTVRVQTEDYGEVKLFARPGRSGGWVIEVQFPSPVEVFNPALRAEDGKKLLKTQK